MAGMDGKVRQKGEGAPVATAGGASTRPAAERATSTARPGIAPSIFGTTGRPIPLCLRPRRGTRGIKHWDRVLFPLDGRGRAVRPPSPGRAGDCHLAGIDWREFPSPGASIVTEAK